MEVREPVGKPRDRVRLSRSCRVLDQVLAAWSLGARGLKQASYGLPLVEAREDDLPATRADAGDGIDLLSDLQVHKSFQDLQPVIPLQHPLPQVGGGCAIRVDRITSTAIIAEVKRQEHRVRTI